MAKDLVRTRRYVKKFMLMKANIQAVSMKIQTLRSQNAMAEAMKGVTKAMQNMNRYAQLTIHSLSIYSFLRFRLLSTLTSKKWRVLRPPLCLL